MVNYENIRFRHSLQSSSSQPRKSIVLIKRSKKRWFKNHDSIHDSLKILAEHYNLTLEVFSDKNLPSLNETVKMFNRAIIVVAPHSAGNSNLVFSEPGTVLVEGLCQNPVHCYIQMARNIGLRYHGIIFPDSKKTCLNFTVSDILPSVCKAVHMFRKNHTKSELCE